MQTGIQLVVAFSSLCWLAASAQKSIHQNSSVNPLRDDRHGKFLGLFNLAINNNQACRALNGDIGTCLSYAECFTFRGSVSGTCNSGFGFCCVNEKTCQGTIYGNNTYFVNQDYPSSYTSAGQCAVTIHRLTPNICQLRLDFETFSISQPDISEHRCVSDSFVVTGTTSPVPVICGDNTGQHSIFPFSLSVVLLSLPLVIHRYFVFSFSVFKHWLRQRRAHINDDDHQQFSFFSVSPGA